MTRCHASLKGKVTRLEIARELQYAGGPVWAALGFFDGLHIGHAAVIGEILQGPCPAVVTFGDAPKSHLSAAPPFYLCTERQRRALLEQMGIQRLIELDFEKVRDWSAEEFFLRLVKDLGVQRLSCGYNFHFGRNGVGDAALLQSLGGKHGVAVTVCPPVVAQGVPVSSTRIRELLEKGDPETAAQLLGRPFSFDFKVIGGDRRGRLLGAPTINQALPKNFVHPRFGVYAARARVNGSWLPALTNVGIRPTVGADYARAETYILDFSGDLYGQNVEVRLDWFLRDEKKFSSVEALKEGIFADVERVRAYYRKK